MKNKNIVTASEIGEYVYCQRAWWLRLNGYLEGSAHAMDIGTKKHNNLFNSLGLLPLKKIIAISLIVLGLIIFSITLAFLIV
jgi:CRISPR/Cas system-associated exonuclease Cas4 (RecB family)